MTLAKGAHQGAPMLRRGREDGSCLGINRSAGEGGAGDHELQDSSGTFLASVCVARVHPQLHKTQERERTTESSPCRKPCRVTRK